MDRRSFLATSGLAATAPLLSTISAPAAATDRASGLFKRVDFRSDGLALDPREYAAVLNELAASGIEADNYSNGGMIRALEQQFAERLGKQAAIFLPTGTLANHLAIRALAGSAQRVLVQAESHLFNDSGDGASALSGLSVVPLAVGQPTVTLDEVRQWVERTTTGRVAMRIGAISIESPVRRCDHRMVDATELERVGSYARANGIRLHLDGARMFNLPQHSGRSVRAIAALFDTVYVSLWKHFNGMAGAILAGESTLIDGLYHMRRMFGGSLPHAWPTVAPVLQYLDGYEERYAQSWRAADELFAQLSASGQFAIRRLQDGTSRVYVRPIGAPAATLVERVGRHGIMLPAPRADSGEIPFEINPTLLRAAPADVARTLIQAARA